ncbi:Rieske (2Fe-2S) protein [Streptacidiphilus anmyonensis]|uniref:Rieske (2Fe-2S) protein n=1 Tax=Streptacidiphilus anmyonensis TaxID=405782 RepID=UPI000A04D979|nr:Rieske (2Fe-2S) protein [Streptacidiphilus anmyonensis]
MNSESANPATGTETAGCCRRQLLRGAAAVGIAGAGVAVLSACGGSSSASAQKGPVTLGPTSDVPVGGGKVYRDQQVVVTQPSAGTFKAFSAICTHAGCVVDGVDNGLITCPCHGSQFKTTDGSVAQGPAQTALPSIPVAVQNGKLVATLS